MPRSSTRPCSTAPARTSRPTVRRMANLLQVSSPFGRAMETVDRVAMCRALFPVLLAEEGGRRVRQLPGQRHRRLRRGLRLPDQPRPRPADRRPGTPDPGRPGPPGRRRGLDPGSVRVRPGRPGCPHPPAPATAAEELTRCPQSCSATCWTHAGDAMPVAGRHLSPLDLRARAEAVAAAGFTGIGFTIDDLEAAKATYGLPQVRRICDDLGLVHLEVELLENWWTTGRRRRESDQTRASLLHRRRGSRGATDQDRTRRRGRRWRRPTPGRRRPLGGRAAPAGRAGRRGRNPGGAGTAAVLQHRRLPAGRRPRRRR